MADENTKENNIIDSVVYDYGADNSQLEVENRLLKETIDHFKRELDKYKSAPLIMCEIIDIIKDQAIVRLQNGNEFLVNVSCECKDITPGDTALAEQKNLTIIKKAPHSKKFNVEKFVIIEKPKVSWDDIGGLKDEINEIHEIVELPLKKPALFKKMGIKPPKGALLYGEPGTGKTLLAKAVASSTNSTFIEVVASELVQKFIGEGAKLIKEIFELAREKAPSIVFIDELDALAAKRIDVGTSGEREVQRTFMQLLAEIDGFKNLGNVKIIGCTNRKDILDPAILRPGRLDRIINVSLPDKEGIRQIYNIHTGKMPLDKDVNEEKIIKKLQGYSGAEIATMCTEAGYFAIRENRQKVIIDDFLNAIDKVNLEKSVEDSDFVSMFG
ncbi:MAG: AAA family ATPase [Nanoarchaeota archaeon]|nr:AAA family ATPase [Nanoarchaeota archaeon]